MVADIWKEENFVYNFKKSKKPKHSVLRHGFSQISFLVFEMFTDGINASLLRKHLPLPLSMKTIKSLLGRRGLHDVNVY